MVLHNPNNWHWVNKDVSGWTKEFLEARIKEVNAEANGVTAQLDKLISMDGDVDVNQRKGKVITIFDVKLVIEYSGRINKIKILKPRLTGQAKPRTTRMSAEQSPSLR
jgi:activator of HSP90 ATPase